ncbi:hypothetical protein KM043_017196 [Ampulex compressa]|nr:hypothetical protein KM043_017196 [Ampulex compressa]
MATGTVEGGGHTALENTTTTALTESSSSSSSSVATILTESPTTASNLPLPGSQQGLHQVPQHQQQQAQQQQQQSHSRSRVNLVTEVLTNDATDDMYMIASTMTTIDDILCHRRINAVPDNVGNDTNLSTGNITSVESLIR